MEIIKFTCTKCGKCCHTTPKITFSEIFELSNEFLFKMNHNTLLFKNETPIEQNILKHYSKFSTHIHIPEIPAEMFWFLDFSIINNGPCQKLEQLGTCRIFDKRPLSCQLAPLSPYKPLQKQKDSVTAFKRFEKCTFDGSPIIWIAGDRLEDINLSEHHDEVFFSYLNDIRLFSQSYLEFIENRSPLLIDEFFKSLLFNQLNTKTTKQTDISIPIQIAVKSNFIMPSFAKEVLNNQIYLIDKQLDAPTTEQKDILLDFKKEYNKVLKNDIFNYSMESELSFDFKEGE